MPRIAIELLLRQLEAAYRGDPFHALRSNVTSVQPDEWDVRPADYSVDVFGERPELTISDVVLHVGGALVMYRDCAFGDASLQWGDISVPAERDPKTLIDWLDRVHGEFAEGLAALGDDAELAAEVPAPWRTPLRRDLLVGLTVNHQLYHSGEVNRQRTLIRGSSGWERHA